eukprot:TRINITY_DN3028_c0_g1_i2.p1 TRINITY_DN3028_c0_g1~~TRINITY_DN3028_c0_g1_i2.p1  ORF type:complete len:359 (+),score=43.99 TRINITY_DN3028_c0_g1_i2:60-1136(+)
MMTVTSKSVRFCEPEVKEYESVTIKVSWKVVPHHTPGVGEEDMVEFDADNSERQGQKKGKLSTRVHHLLALGRAAELRASVLTYLTQPSASSSRLPDIAVPRRTRRASAPPTSAAARPRRPVPQARERRLSVDGQNVGLTPVAPAAQETGNIDGTVSESNLHSEPVAMADVTCPDVKVSVVCGCGIDRDSGALVHAPEMFEPRFTPIWSRQAEGSCLEAWTSEDAKAASIENESNNDTEQRAHVASQHHFPTLIPQKPSELGAQVTSNDPLPLSPVPPRVEVVRTRPRAPHRRFGREANPQTSSNAVQDLGAVTGALLDPPIPFSQQLPVDDEATTSTPVCSTGIASVEFRDIEETCY